jgi:NAD(P)-dependent dehydrogenase (short-subunit alcohol dehydrogenase family)
LGYCASKAANVLTTDEVARREPGLVSNSFHPGSVATNLTRNVLPDLTVEKAGAYTHSKFS